VAIHHVVLPHEGFEDAARVLFHLIRRAQEMNHASGGMLSLDIEGHRQADGTFDADMYGLQRDFLLGRLGAVSHGSHYPLVTVGTSRTPDDDIPEDVTLSRVSPPVAGVATHDERFQWPVRATGVENDYPREVGSSSTNIPR
jgi:hypothetical protein